MSVPSHFKPQTELLQKILFDHNFFAQFSADPVKAAGSSYAGTDLKQLTITATAVRRNLMQGSAGQVLHLQKIFPQSLALMDELAPDLKASTLGQKFMASPYYPAYSNVPYRFGKYSLEEAFYLFARQEAGQDLLLLEEILRQEALASLYQRLCVCKTLNFKVPEHWGRLNAQGHYETVQVYHFDFKILEQRTYKMIYQARPYVLHYGEIV